MSTKSKEEKIEKRNKKPPMKKKRRMHGDSDEEISHSRVEVSEYEEPQSVK